MLASLQLGEAAGWAKLRDMLLKLLFFVPSPQLWLSQQQSWSWRKATGLSCECLLSQVGTSWQQASHAHSHEIPFSKQLFSGFEAKTNTPWTC